MPPGNFYFGRIGEVMEVPILVSESILHIHFIHCQFGKRKTFISFQSANLQPISLLFTPFLFTKSIEGNNGAKRGPEGNRKGQKDQKTRRGKKRPKRGQKVINLICFDMDFEGNKGKKGARRPGLAGP